MQSRVVNEITSMYRKLPPRPSLDELEAAIAFITNSEREEKQRMKEIKKQSELEGVSPILFSIYQEFRMSSVQFETKHQNRKALELLDLEKNLQMFDDLITRANHCVSQKSKITEIKQTTSKDFSRSSISSSSRQTSTSKRFTTNDSYIMKGKAISTAQTSSSPGQDEEKWHFMKLVTEIETVAKNEIMELNLQNKLHIEIDCLPESIGKLSRLLTLNLSMNQLMKLPISIAGLSSLVRLDLRSNRIYELPDSIGDLSNLVFLNLRGNQLFKLPCTLNRLVNLEELDLSLNKFDSLPGTIGSLVKLTRLNAESNNIEELPYNLSHCKSLRELRVGHNKLRSIPDEVGRIVSLEILSARHNRIRDLPCTLALLSKLRELDLSFNDLKALPETMCFAISLVRLNISNNFTNLTSLPQGIGNLESLEVLDMSYNQIRVFPDSFRLLARLSLLRTDHNGMEVPPSVIENGAQAVVWYVEQLVAIKAAKKKWKRLFSRRARSESSSPRM